MKTIQHPTVITHVRHDRLSIFLPDDRCRMVGFNGPELTVVDNNGDILYKKSLFKPRFYVGFHGNDKVVLPVGDAKVFLLLWFEVAANPTMELGRAKELAKLDPTRKWTRKPSMGQLREYVNPRLFNSGCEFISQEVEGIHRNLYDECPSGQTVVIYRIHQRMLPCDNKGELGVCVYSELWMAGR